MNDDTRWLVLLIRLERVRFEYPTRRFVHTDQQCYEAGLACLLWVTVAGRRQGGVLQQVGAFGCEMRTGNHR
jgi:hypothetical protein